MRPPLSPRARMRDRLPWVTPSDAIPDSDPSDDEPHRSRPTSPDVVLPGVRLPRRTVTTLGAVVLAAAGFLLGLVAGLVML